jgi:serine/threonine protein phosphatase PrpC
VNGYPDYLKKDKMKKVKAKKITKKSVKKVSKKKSKKTTARKKNPNSYQEKIKKAEEELKKAKFAFQTDVSRVGSALSRSLHNKYVQARERYDDLMYSDD